MARKKKKEVEPEEVDNTRLHELEAKIKERDEKISFLEDSLESALKKKAPEVFKDTEKDRATAVPFDVNEERMLKAAKSAELGEVIKGLEITCGMCGKALRYNGQHMTPNGRHTYERDCKHNNSQVHIRPSEEQIKVK